MAEATDRDVQNYVTPDGWAPFEDWISKLRDQRAKARIFVRIDRVRLGTSGRRSSKTMPTKSYDEFLHQELREPEMAAEYLSTALEEGSVTQFLVALRNVAEAHGGVGVLSNITELNRQSATAG